MRASLFEHQRHRFVIHPHDRLLAHVGGNPSIARHRISELGPRGPRCEAPTAQRGFPSDRNAYEVSGKPGLIE
jgi:hypothetical protein